VIFRDNKDRVAKIMPLDPSNELWPDKLWDYMDGYEKSTGGKVLAIPHNANLSNGLMFMMTDPSGGPMTAAQARRRRARAGGGNHPDQGRQRSPSVPVTKR
jgi:hypothetical protein